MTFSAALVSYINTRPYIDGLRKFFSPEELVLNLLPPADCVPELLEGRCELALIPVGALLDFQDLGLMKDHCIGADGPVDSVFLFSQTPVSEIEEVVLDSHSRTSNGLTRVLMARHWKRDVPFRLPQKRSFEEIKGKTAGVVIGDKAYKIRDQFKHVYDLSAAWKEYTGLPFVFAVWAYRPESLGEETLEKVRQALEWGRRHREAAAEKWAPEFGYTPAQARRYLCESIQYALDAPKHAALHRYFSELKELDAISHENKTF